MNDDYVVVGRLEAFPERELRKVQVAGQDVVVANIDGMIYAIAGSCTHRGAPLHEGELEGTTVTCPWHGGQFDITTGKVVSPPPMRDVSTFEVRIIGSDVMLRKKQFS
jgi:nitrite reductase/ring-hydroxylating ferredoxin subunit